MSVLILPTICHSSIVVGHGLLVIGRWSLVIRQLSFAVCHGIISRYKEQMTSDKGQMTNG